MARPSGTIRRHAAGRWDADAPEKEKNWQLEGRDDLRKTPVSSCVNSMTWFNLGAQLSGFDHVLLCRH
jgi:hypothetical protein